MMFVDWYNIDSLSKVIGKDVKKGKITEVKIFFTLSTFY